MELFDLENTRMLFYFLEKCEGIIQKAEHHPEGDVFTHSLQVVSLAFRETYDTDLIIAAMLHDVGKIIYSNEHPRIGCVLLYPYVSVKTLFLIEHHMRIWSYIKGEMKKRSKCEFLMSHPWLSELIQLARWDHMGRNPNRKIKYDKLNIIDRLNKCIEKHFVIPEHLRDSNERENQEEIIDDGNRT